MAAHENWAQYYDFVYETSFGRIYSWLTDITIDEIKKIIGKDKCIIDYGAGTGRLTLPLIKSGFKTIAVEKSSEMLKVLQDKAADLNLNAPVFNCSIKDYDGEKADMALCIFTVLSYIITKEELESAIKNIFNHLNKGGYVFFDLPNDVFFQQTAPFQINKYNLNRTISLTPTDTENVYAYSEKCSGVFNNKDFEYQDSFPIRHWSNYELEEILNQIGFVGTNRSFDEFDESDASYKLYQKK
jgi:SAM-dependent methyltransferase